MRYTKKYFRDKRIKQKKARNKMICFLLIIITCFTIPLIGVLATKPENVEMPIVTVYEPVLQSEPFEDDLSDLDTETNNVPKEAKETQGSAENESTREIITRLAIENGFKYDIDYLLRLSYCESRHNPLAVNGNGNKPATSVDRGLWQWNSYWQPGISDECAYDVECSTVKAIEKINAGYQHLWACDKIVKGRTKEQLGYKY